MGNEENTSARHATRQKINRETKKVAESKKTAKQVVWYIYNNNKLLKRTRLIFKDAPPKTYSTYVGRTKGPEKLRMEEKIVSLKKEGILFLDNDDDRIKELIRKAA